MSEQSEISTDKNTTTHTDAFQSRLQEGPWIEAEPFDLHGSHIKMLGIEHDTSKYDEVAEKVEELVNWADIVLVEYLRFDKDLHDPIRQPLVDMLYLSSEGTLGFYNKVLDAAENQQKMVGSIDPDGVNMTIWKSLLGSIGIAAAIPLLGAPFAKKDHRLTRRDFLKLGLTYAGVSYLSGRANPIGGSLVRAITNARDYGKADMLLADVVNYRDIQGAENLDRLTKKLEEKGGRNIGYVAGKEHPRVLREYVLGNHDTEKLIKTPINKLHGLFANNEIRLYKTTPFGGWVKDTSLSDE